NDLPPTLKDGSAWERSVVGVPIRPKAADGDAGAMFADGAELLAGAGAGAGDGAISTGAGAGAGAAAGAGAGALPPSCDGAAGAACVVPLMPFSW
ncbi:hypothetical protein ACO2WH_24890, partial [Escherichia coli]|uniref:hypothetical protein n=1 Tax=Escherichia coli TaxID=562 RepID=UPI003C048730